MQVGAHDAYVSHEAKLAAAQSDLSAKIGAAEAAAELDRQAAVERRQMLRTMDPHELVEGITRDRCPDACSKNECVLAGGLPRCAHPCKGGLSVELWSDPVIGALRTAALDEIKAVQRGDYDEEEDEDEGDFDEVDDEEASEELEDNDRAA
jgi:hypothetical protein